MIDPKSRPENNGSFQKRNLKKYIYIALVVSSIAAAGPAWKKIEIPDKYKTPEDISKMVNHNLVLQQARRISFREAFRLISYFCSEGLYLSDEE